MELKALYPLIRLNAPGVPNVVLDVVAEVAARDFLTRTEVWTSELVNPMPYSEGATLYDPTPQIPSGTTLVSIQKVRWRPTGEEILFLTGDQLNESFPGWETETDEAPEYYTLNAPTVARLYPIADATVPAAVEMSVSLTIAPGQTTFPDWIFNQYQDALVAGALARLYKMPRREWTDLRLAGVAKQEFDTAVDEARSAAQSSFGHPTYEVIYGGL
jgi:hypothetical protein